MQEVWENFLSDLSQKNKIAYIAAKSFEIHKKSSFLIEILYSSLTAKAEFTSVEPMFFTHFRNKINNHKVEITYQHKPMAKMEIMTTRKQFEKMMKENPLLKDLDDLMKFDFS